jgi:uncharacterized iron-regulated membrane protein
MSTQSIIKRAASIIAVSVVLTGAAMQSARAADDNAWFLHQEEQTDGNFQNDDAAPTTSTPATSAQATSTQATATQATATQAISTPTVGTDDQASPATADKGQTTQSDVYDELQHNRD